MSETVLSKPDKELALRDYQRDLLARTQSAQQSSSVSQKRLAFSAGGYRWLIQMEDAIEIMPMPPVVPVPGTYDWFRGLMNYRGRLVSVIDFNRLLAGPEASKNKDDRLIILSDRLRKRFLVLKIGFGNWYVKWLWKWDAMCDLSWTVASLK